MILETNNLTKKYDENNMIQDINISIDKPCVYGLIGPNGSGKSTILGMITSLIRPTSGEVKAYGENITNRPCKDIGFLAHETEKFSNDTPIESLVFYNMLNGNNKKKSKEMATELLDLVGIGKAKYKKIRNMSNGMKKLLGIAQAISSKPRILLLDEPFSGLDFNSRINIRNTIKNVKATIIISSHNLEEMEKLCDRVGIIKNGRIVIDDDISNLKLIKNQITLEFEKLDEKIISRLRKLRNVIGVKREQNHLKLNFSKKTELCHVTDFLDKNKIQAISAKQGYSIEDIFIDIA